MDEFVRIFTKVVQDTAATLDLDAGLALFGAAVCATSIAYRRKWRRSQDAPIHATLDPPLGRSERVLVIGDVHGCLDEMQQVVTEATGLLPPNMPLRVVLVGDLVNKGPFSAEVVQFVRRKGWACVMGNHDLAAIKRFDLSDGASGKYSWISSLTDEDKQWLVDRPYTISIPSMNSVVVHAGLVPGRALQEQKASDMTLMRNVWRNGKHLEAANTTEIGSPWADAWSTPAEHDSGKSKVPHVYFGHDAKRGLQHCDKATGLDTGACYGRNLTGMILPDRLIVEVRAKRVYQEPAGGSVSRADGVISGSTSTNIRIPGAWKPQSPVKAPMTKASKEAPNSPKQNFSKSLNSKISRRNK